jgi:hypothetical protein
MQSIALRVKCTVSSPKGKHKTNRSDFGKRKDRLVVDKKAEREVVSAHEAHIDLEESAKQIISRTSKNQLR